VKIVLAKIAFIETLESEADLPMRQGGAAAPATAGVDPLVPPMSSSSPAAKERRRPASDGRRKTIAKEKRFRKEKKGLVRH
jgi:hypothetical protein